MLRVMLFAAASSAALIFSGCSSSSSGACSPANCTGCCGSDNLCHNGATDNFCGSSANQCAVCGSSQSCNSGKCTGASSGGADAGTVLPPIDGGSVISGRVTYERVPSSYSPSRTTSTLLFNNVVEKPVRNGVVQVIQGTTVLAAGTTDADGRYSLRYLKNGSGEVRIYALTRTNSPAIQVQDNTDGRAVYAVYAPIGLDNLINIHAVTGWTGTAFNDNERLASPFAVLDTMYTTAQAFIAVRPNVQFPALKVNWSSNNAPQTGDNAQGQIGTSHFSPQENEIYVLGKAGADIDEFDDHVISHEWGHYFEANLSRSDSPGGRHGPGDVLDPRIAFGEAWGNALSAMVLNNPLYFDCLWGQMGLSCFGWDSETAPVPTDDPMPSAFSESSVLRALYDLYDGNSAAENFDRVSLGLGPIYDTMVGPEKSTEAMTTLASFIRGLKTQNNVNAADVDTLLAHWGIGSITSDFGRNDQELSGIYTDAASLPYSGSISLGGGSSPNSWQQNQYYIFQGTGTTMQVTASSAYDVAIAVYRQGMVVGKADLTTSGIESISMQSTNGATYVLVLTGYGEVNADYPVSVSIQ